MERRRVRAWWGRELARILSQLPLAERTILAHALGQFVKAAGEGYGPVSPDARRRPGTCHGSALETGTVLAGGRDYACVYDPDRPAVWTS